MMWPPPMPPFVRRRVEGRSGPLLLAAGAGGLGALGAYDYLSLAWALGIGIALSIFAMVVREWVWSIRQTEMVQASRGIDRLERATAGRHGGYVEEVEQIWWIGADGSADRGQVKYRTTVTKVPKAQGGASEMAWRRVRVFASSTIPMASWEAMDFRGSDPGGPVEAIRVKESGGEVDYVVFFNKPLQPGVACEWQVDYNWPQFFDPWRKNGDDHCSVDFSVDAAKASIRVVWPAGQAPTKFRRRSPSAGTVTAVDFGGLNSLLWEFGPCKPGQVFRVDL